MWLDELQELLSKNQTSKAVALTSDSLQIGMNEAATLVDKMRDDGSEKGK